MGWDPALALALGVSLVRQGPDRAPQHRRVGPRPLPWRDRGHLSLAADARCVTGGAQGRSHLWPWAAPLSPGVRLATAPLLAHHPDGGRRGRSLVYETVSR